MDFEQPAPAAVPGAHAFLAASAAEDEATLGDDDPTVGWRTETLEKAGYPYTAAHLLARNGRVDLHDAVSLAKRGCPVETALAILL